MSRADEWSRTYAHGAADALSAVIEYVQLTGTGRHLELLYEEHEELRRDIEVLLELLGDAALIADFRRLVDEQARQDAWAERQTEWYVDTKKEEL